MRLMRMIGLGLTAYSAYKMMKGASGPRTMPRAGGGMQTYRPAMGTSSRPGIDLMKRHGGRRGAL